MIMHLGLGCITNWVTVVRLLAGHSNKFITLEKRTRESGFNIDFKQEHHNASCPVSSQVPPLFLSQHIPPNKTNVHLCEFVICAVNVKTGTVDGHGGIGSEGVDLDAAGVLLFDSNNSWTLMKLRKQQAQNRDAWESPWLVKVNRSVKIFRLPE